MVPFSQEIAEHLLMERGELFPSFALLVHVAFALPIKLSLTQARNFRTFTLQILCPIPLQGNEQATGQCLAAT